MTPSQKQAIEQEAERLYPIPTRPDNMPYMQQQEVKNETFIEGATFGLSLQTNDWVRVSPETLPKSEVLAFNGSDYLLGYLGISKMTGNVKCETEYENLYDVTHYQLPTPPNK